ncbi:MAG: Unknown protein [uncultured Sulfurovum sp.]|uniref:Uncharacterized protein n=1 Tax=uncultured Sulfurovum sp. TaxID=269237 RepID=A0A6S6U030_9BACT|nr:MAG: Unknown protein [uncultured Sulfurovum sp.]
MTHNTKFAYDFTPAKVLSNFTPLVVIVYDQKEHELQHIEYKMWNILTVENHVASHSKEELQTLIKRLVDEYECEDHIYFYGSEIGGYNAMLHAVINNANALYAYNPQMTEIEENNLSTLLNTTEDTPIFYLCNSQNASQVNSFIEKCKKNHIKVNLEHCPKSDYQTVHTLQEVLDFLSRMVSQI